MAESGAGVYSGGLAVLWLVLVGASLLSRPIFEGNWSYIWSFGYVVVYDSVQKFRALRLGFVSNGAVLRIDLCMMDPAASRWDQE